MTKKLAFLVTAFAILAGAQPAFAQKAAAVHRVGFLSRGTAEVFKPWMAGFRQGLNELGYVEGQNILIEERYAAGRADRLATLAAQLVRLDVDVMLTHGSATLIADRVAKEAGKAIPVVFAIASDPVASGYVASLAHPGGNITGLSDAHSELVPKRLELLKEVVPGASRIAVLWSPSTDNGSRQLKTLQAVAPSLGVTLLPLVFAKSEDLDRVFAAIRKERPDALNILGYPLAGAHRKRIAAFALERRLPAILTVRLFPAAGGLMSYGASFPDIYRRAATYVHKILRGAKPADLPVEQPTTFELVVNLKTAKAMGLTLPPSILLRATEVIE